MDSFKTPFVLVQLGCVLLIMAGLVGLKLASAASASAATTKEMAFVNVYLGSYGDQIQRATLEVSSGSLSVFTPVADLKNASFVAVHPTLRVLYAASESSDGAVSAFAFAGSSPLKLINAASLKDGGACHVSVGGDVVFTSNYGDGTVAAFAIDANGRLGESTFTEKHAGASTVKGRQDGPHAHSVVFDRTRHFAVGADLGTDELTIYRIANTVVTRVGVTRVMPGSGPRHSAFSTDNRFVYVVNELSNTLATFSFDADSGALKFIEETSTLAPDFKGASFLAEVAVHPDGRFLYASNRGHDSIAVFALDQATGKAKRVSTVPCGGKWPRHFAIHPAGDLMLVANQKSDQVAVFRLNSRTGIPELIDTVAAKAPACIAFGSSDD